MSHDGFTGLEQMDELMAQLEELGLSITAEVEDRALQAGAEVAKEKIEQHPNIPVSKYNKQHAKDHIEIVKAKDGQYKVGALNEYFYLLFHEIGAEGGTYKDSKGKTHKTPRTPAKPFMRPAFENNKEEIEKAMMEVIKRELNL